MARHREEHLRTYDLTTILICLVLMLIGVLMIYAAEYDAGNTGPLLSFEHSYSKQLVFAVASMVLGGMVMLVESRFYRTFAFLFYAVAIVLLVLVLFFAREINGSRSWFDFGWIRLQPAEYAKCATALALASVLSSNSSNLHTWKDQMKSLGILALPMSLILLQGDLGSTVVFTSFFILLFREGLPQLPYVVVIVVGVLSIGALLLDNTLPITLGLLLLSNLVIGLQRKLDLRRLLLASLWVLGSVLLFGWGYPMIAIGANAVLLVSMAVWYRRQQWQLSLLLIVGSALAAAYTYSINFMFYRLLKPHQQERIMVWLRPEKCDPQGSMYNLLQSKNAIGSGGLLGKGFLNGGYTSGNYVPAQSTDFIFCTVGEEQGFLGAALVIGLLAGLMLRVIHLAERQRSPFSRVYAYGVLGILFYHVFINIGMTIGLMPVIGIPLPFVSYGGSSLMAFSLLMAILIKLDSDRYSAFR